jgi:hypothetical protein
MKKWLLLFVFSFAALIVNAQFTDRYWCFGDSAGIDFSNLNNPSAAHSVLRARGTCASICDSAGNLLFYSGSPDVNLWLNTFSHNEGYVLNRNHLLMQNGDSIVSQLWYQEMTIVPNPGNSNQFYIFSSGVVAPPGGFYYSIVDLSYNGGLGKIIQKNVQLQTYPINDGLAAVKNGNGRDWWITMKPTSNSAPLDEFNTYLISPSGISNPIIQHIGSQIRYGGFIRLKFTKDGNKLYSVHADNLIESYDFDRCSGLISNANTIHVSNSSGPYKTYWSEALSPDGSKLYVCSIYQGSNQDTSYILQYDLNASNILSSVDTLNTLVQPPVWGLLQPGPDGKIYISCFNAINDCATDYLYCDTTHNMYIDNISVINSPNNLGVACNFQPFSFNLGGHRTYYGLPNNPNYELGPDSGSVCDTLSVGLQGLYPRPSELFVFYHPQLYTAFINAQNIVGKVYVLSVYDIAGNEVFHESGKLDSEYFTRDLQMTGFSSGMYIVSLTTDKEKLVKKFVK